MVDPWTGEEGGGRKRGEEETMLWAKVRGKVAKERAEVIAWRNHFFGNLSHMWGKHVGLDRSNESHDFVPSLMATRANANTEASPRFRECSGPFPLLPVPPLESPGPQDILCSRTSLLPPPPASPTLLWFLPQGECGRGGGGSCLQWCMTFPPGIHGPALDHSSRRLSSQLAVALLNRPTWHPPGPHVAAAASPGVQPHDHRSFGLGATPPWGPVKETGGRDPGSFLGLQKGRCLRTGRLATQPSQLK